MVGETEIIIGSTSKNSSGTSWEIIWIPYHDGEDGATSILSPSNTIRSKYPEKVYMGMSWNNDIYLLERARLSNWDNYISTQ